MLAGYLQDVLAVLDALLVPAVEDALHAAVAHSVVQAGEEAEPEGAGHGGGAGRAPPALIEGLPREGRAVAGCGQNQEPAPRWGMLASLTAPAAPWR